MRRNADIETEVNTLRHHPWMRALLDAYDGPAMVVEGDRRIVLANASLAVLLGRDAESIVGERPGEAMACRFAAEAPAGCGSGPSCSTCGTLQALRRTMHERVADRQECRIQQQRTDGPHAFEFHVTTTPIVVEGLHLTILSMRETTDEKRRAALERIFFHDILNVAGGLQGLLTIGSDPELAAGDRREADTLAVEVATQLVEEIQAQRDLLAAERGELHARKEPVRVAEVLRRLRAVYERHPVTHGRTIAWLAAEDVWVRTDPVLLGRVLGNLLKNSLEASSEGETVRVSFDADPEPRFEVWNRREMPADVKLQVFQRSFSTKAPSGRGLGTWSVKLIVERYLGGHVSFASSPESGTTFVVRLPGD